MKRRAELEEQTRRRIAQAAVDLHRTLGPSQTSISALAEHAGVRRSTVYRHFPDELAIFTACTLLWRDQNPAPDLSRWAAIEDVEERLGSGLTEMYQYFRRTENMMSNILRDEATMPNVGKMLEGFYQYLSEARNVLMVGRKMPEQIYRQVNGAIGHALAFHTWRSLAFDQNLSDDEAAGMMCLLVNGIVGRTETEANS